MKKTKAHKEKPKFVCGFTTSKGLMLDLDHTTQKETVWIAEKYLERFKLEGYLILKSSENNYHIVFNRYLTWKKVLSCLFKIVWYFHYHKHGTKPSLTFWSMLQACKESETLRISAKKEKGNPQRVKRKGKTDKLIADYIQFSKTMNKKTKPKEQNA